MFRNVLAGFLSTVFVLFFLPLAFVAGVYTTFADKDFYTGEFVDVVYESLLTELPKLAVSKAAPGLAVEDVKSLIQEIISKDDLRAAVLDLVNQFVLAEVRDGKIQGKISLKWLSGKTDLIAEKTSALVVTKLPVCGRGEEPFTETEGIKCVPKGMAQRDVEMMIKNLLKNGGFADLPGEFVYNLDAPGNFQGNISEFFTRIAGYVFLAGGLFLFLILLLIGLINFRPWSRILKWEFKTIFCGALFLAMTAVFMFYMPNLFKIFYSNFHAGLASDEVELVAKLIDLLIGSVAKNLLIFSVPATVGSLAGWIVSGIFYSRKKHG